MEEEIRELQTRAGQSGTMQKSPICWQFLLSHMEEAIPLTSHSSLTDQQFCSKPTLQIRLSEIFIYPRSLCTNKSKKPLSSPISLVSTVTDKRSSENNAGSLNSQWHHFIIPIHHMPRCRIGEFWNNVCAAN